MLLRNQCCCGTTQILQMCHDLVVSLAQKAINAACAIEHINHDETFLATHCFPDSNKAKVIGASGLTGALKGTLGTDCQICAFQEGDGLPVLLEEQSSFIRDQQDLVCVQNDTHDSACFASKHLETSKNLPDST